MARTFHRQGLVRLEEAPANLIGIKVSFWRRYITGLLKAQWGLKTRETGYLRRRVRGPGVGSGSGVGVGTERIGDIEPKIRSSGGVQSRRNKQSRGPRLWS